MWGRLTCYIPDAITQRWQLSEAVVLAGGQPARKGRNESNREVTKKAGNKSRGGRDSLVVEGDSTLMLPWLPLLFAIPITYNTRRDSSQSAVPLFTAGRGVSRTGRHTKTMCGSLPGRSFTLSTPSFLCAWHTTWKDTPEIWAQAKSNKNKSHGHRSLICSFQCLEKMG